MMKKFIKIITLTILSIMIIIGGINMYIYHSTKDDINTDLSFDADCILILGAGVRNNQPTPMLNDRLLVGIQLYKDKKAKKIIMSGDHGRDDYNEVGVMKQFAIEKGVLSSDIFMDHAGFSTYESLYRAKNIFQAKKVIIITQEYHLYRSLYIARSLGLEAIGYSANLRPYRGQIIREGREILTRCKDFMSCIFQVKPTYLGDTIPVNDNGDCTNDSF